MSFRSAFRKWLYADEQLTACSYVVTDEDNIGEKISKIITLELLKY